MPQIVEPPHINDLTKALFGDANAGPSAPAKAPQSRHIWMYVAGLIAVIAVIAAVMYFRKAPAAAWGTAAVKRMTISKTISATGRLQVLTTVQTGTQASDTISGIYADFNSEVKKGRGIAKRDPARMPAQWTASTAQAAGRVAARTERSCLTCEMG